MSGRGLQAIVLAAGIGRRMQPLTNACHKALLDVGGTTILARIVDSLLAVGITDITVVTGYRATDVSSYLHQRYPGTTFQFINNPRFAETNNIVSLSLALEHARLDGDVVLIECDLLFDPALLERLARRTGNVALLDRYRTGMDGTVVSVAGGSVTQVYPPHAQGPDFAYGDKFKTLNIYRFDRDFLRRTLRPLVHLYANQIDENCYYELVLGMLTNIPAHRIAAEVVEGDLWAEVDDPNDLAVARFQFVPEQRAEILDRSFGGHWSLDVRDHSFMRNVHFPTEAMIAALRHALPALLSSYGSTQIVLNEKLGLVVGAQPERLQALHGATQAFPILRDLFSGSASTGRRRVAIPRPTFGELPRVFPEAVTYADGPSDPMTVLAALEHLAAEGGTVVVVNPNNPTGTTLPTAQLHDLVRRHSGTTFLVDESFIGFSGEESLVARLERDPLPNVHVLVSMSKTYGVPGLRLGYVYSCDPAFLAQVGDLLPIWNLSAVAEFFLELLLKFRVEHATSIDQTIADREELRAALVATAGVAEVHQSGGDFLLVRLRGLAGLGDRVRRFLLTELVIDVKDVTSKFADGQPRLRVGVRSSPENLELATALGEALARSGDPPSDGATTRTSSR